MGVVISLGVEISSYGYVVKACAFFPKVFGANASVCCYSVPKYSFNPCNIFTTHSRMDSPSAISVFDMVVITPIGDQIVNDFAFDCTASGIGIAWVIIEVGKD